MKRTIRENHYSMMTHKTEAKLSQQLLYSG